MKFQSKLLITTVFISSIALFVLGTYRTLFTQGSDAISRMNESELVLLAKVKQIRKGMSYREVVAILGYPDHEGEFENQASPSQWSVKNSDLPCNSLSVYFSENSQVLKIRWRKYGYFTYEPAL